MQILHFPSKKDGQTLVMLRYWSSASISKIKVAIVYVKKRQFWWLFVRLTPEIQSNKQKTISSGIHFLDALATYILSLLT